MIDRPTCDRPAEDFGDAIIADLAAMVLLPPIRAVHAVLTRAGLIVVVPAVKGRSPPGR
jgi:hypothetical protein